MRTRVLEPVAAFSWGYRIVGGYPDTLDPVRREATGWAGHHRVLATRYPAWTFR
jgi:hypothetical protein